MIKKHKIHIPIPFRYIIGGLCVMCFTPFYGAALFFLAFLGLGLIINCITRDSPWFKNFRSKDNSAEYICPSYSYLPWNSNYKNSPSHWN